MNALMADTPHHNFIVYKPYIFSGTHSEYFNLPLYIGKTMPDSRETKYTGESIKHVVN